MKAGRRDESCVIGNQSVTSIGLTVRSPAKINWNLRVLGRRDDGYHAIESLVSAVSLFDELTFHGRGDSAIRIACDLSSVPVDGRNLIWRAVELLRSASGYDGGVNCRLVKRIPVGGGLGGGSSNGASTLLALNRLWGLDWALERLGPIGESLGSDVPFFLAGGSAVIAGRGERVRRVQLGWRGWIVLLMPGIEVSTAEVYRRWVPVAGSECRSSEGPSDAADSVQWMHRTFNMLEGPAFEVCPALRVLTDKAADLAGRPVRVSGSGSTLFTAFDAEAEARAFADQAGGVFGVETCVVTTVEQSVMDQQVSCA